MATNCTGARVVHQRIDLAYMAFDRLPRGLRDRMNRATIPLDPVQMWNTFLAIAPRIGPQDAERWLITAIGKTEDAELQALARAYESEHGTKLPHVAARASALR